MISIEFCDRQSILTCDHSSWAQMLRELFHEEGFQTGEVSVAIVAETEMHALNRQYLNHDYHTDVLSFVMDRGPSQIDGEIVVSADMAVQRCGEFGWTAEHELNLYLIHGALHLVGYNDKTDRDAIDMRQRERFYLDRFGFGSRSADPSRIRDQCEGDSAGASTS